MYQIDAYATASAQFIQAFCVKTMGKQIEISLTQDDEILLEKYISERFDIRVANRFYPASWDKSALYKTNDTNHWLIIDARAEEILIESANLIDTGPSKDLWQMRSKSYSCIEWERDMRPNPQFPTGRLFLDTSPGSIWKDISSISGDDVSKIYNRACRWLKKNCKLTGRVWSSNHTEQGPIIGSSRRGRCS
ncbi:hypothetical protein [Microbulbifer sp. PAAF003]|uniref:hypothetical protein n=1 Tax=Microbulbifer sp. PAAF003 TaxID=3243375 RepID=UPI004039EF19